VKGQILDLIGSVMELDPYFASVNYSSIYYYIFCNYVALSALSNLRTRTHAHARARARTHYYYIGTCNCVRSYRSLHLVPPENEEFT